MEVKSLLNALQSKKIPVLIIEVNKRSRWRKCHIDLNRKVTIQVGRKGKGNKTITPTITDDAIFTKGIFNTQYGIYNMGAKRFLTRNDKELPSFSMDVLNDFMSPSVFGWIRSGLIQKVPLIHYLILLAQLIILFMVAGGFGYISIPTR